MADLPRDQRIEVLMLHLQSRAGDCRTWLSPVRRTGPGIELAPTVRLEKPPNQQLANLFAE